MKKIFLIAALIVSSCVSVSSFAQVRFQLNIGSQPLWGPTGYDYVQYYYIPEIDAYYNVGTRQYTFVNDGQWITSPYLPDRFANVDLYNTYKVVVNEPNPWMHHERYRNQYYTYRRYHGQPVIRDSRDVRYFENPHHPMHNQWNGHREGEYGGYRHDNGRHEGWDRGRHEGWERHEGGERHEHEDHDHGHGRGHDRD